MSGPLNIITLIVDEVTLGSPAQQLLDRFLVGFTEDGVFKPAPKNRTLRICTQKPDAAVIKERREKFVMFISGSPAEAVKSGEPVLFIQPEGKFDTNGLLEVIQHMGVGAPLFVHGLAGPTKATAETVIRKASERLIPVCFGTVVSVLPHLPPMEIPKRARIREALVVVQGGAPSAEMAGFEGLMPILDAQPGGVPGIRNVRTLEGAAVWDAADRDWSWRLLAAALSRTDKAQGNTALDGRTEDIVGLKLTQKMAKNPRARIIEHANGARTAILVLDGVVADTLVAVKTEGRFSPGRIYSTQLFRSPPPQQEEFSLLTGVITSFFNTGKPPWTMRRAIAQADFFERLSA